MKRLFGTGYNASQQKVDPTEVSESLNTRLESLNKSINNCDGELQKFKQQAARSKGAASAASKRRALEILKRKRMYEQQRDSLYSQQFNLDQASFTKEQMQANIATVDALKVTSKAMKVQMRRTDIGSIEKMQDEMLDLMEDQNELSEILSRNYAVRF
ncbi:putative Charged multivesicular body protein 5 [Cardiosporidium cionae]|uniref:Charged multivesicular body protein 5 n=1 Tax=Cardiosporidium cionae TaxID=476202 RepID=A0ABQ7J742_9APIC|nr:putative Charged multivesicular body protein 5 [Cardiosporidium cionae]|eukprot:KAF8819802.1 putative Charged multivesicular body protein 5 [Cardiosporidium cionae]